MSNPTPAVDPRLKAAQDALAKKGAPAPATGVDVEQLRKDLGEAEAMLQALEDQRDAECNKIEEEYDKLIEPVNELINELQDKISKKEAKQSKRVGRSGGRRFGSSSSGMKA